MRLVGASMKSITERRSKLAKDAVPKEAVKCPKCGRQAKQGESFCKGCGSKLS